MSVESDVFGIHFHAQFSTDQFEICHGVEAIQL